VGFMAGGGGGVYGQLAEEVAEGGFNFGEAYGFKALLYENKKPQKNTVLSFV